MCEMYGIAELVRKSTQNHFRVAQVRSNLPGTSTRVESGMGLTLFALPVDNKR